MATDSPDPGPRANDDAWLALLAGRDAADASPADRAEAQRLRAAFLQVDELRASGMVPQPPDAAWEGLRERARREGLLSAESDRDARTSPGWRVRAAALFGTRPALPWAGLAAACVLALAVGLSWRARIEPPGETLRGGPPIALHAAEPAQTRAALADALRAAGAKAIPYDGAGGTGLDVDWPDAADARVRAALARWQLAPPAGRREIRIEITAIP
jgi:hypothetical protein